MVRRDRASGLPARFDPLVRSGMVGRMRSFLRRNRAASRGGVMRTEIVVIVIVVIALMAILLPMIAAARRSATMEASKDRLRRIGNLVHVYHDVHESFPSGAESRRPATPDR